LNPVNARFPIIAMPVFVLRSIDAAHGDSPIRE
jgi:hypothetical protein